MKSSIALMLFVSAGGVLGWMLLLPGILRVEVESRTGFQMEAESISCNPLGLSLSGENIVIRNPDEFGAGAPMLEIVRMSAGASLPALARGEIWIDSCEIEIAKVVLVRDERGNVNLKAFLDRLFDSSNDSGPMPFYAERVHLMIDEISYVDYSQPVPQSRSIRVALDVELSRLEDANAVFGPIFEIGNRVGAMPSVDSTH